MKVRLLRPARINMNAGDVVDVSPAQANFLLSVGSATPVKEQKEAETKKKETAKKK